MLSWFYHCLTFNFWPIYKKVLFLHPPKPPCPALLWVAIFLQPMLLNRHFVPRCFRLQEASLSSVNASSCFPVKLLIELISMTFKSHLLNVKFFQTYICTLVLCCHLNKTQHTSQFSFRKKNNNNLLRTREWNSCLP